MADKRRQNRVAGRIKEEASSILLHEMKDPRLGFVTVTTVRVTPDLMRAHIYVSVLGEGAEERKTMQALEHARGYVQRAIAERIRLRRAPEITFHIDDSSKKSVRISSLIRQIHEEQNAKDNAPAEDVNGAVTPTDPSRKES